MCLPRTVVLQVGWQRDDLDDAGVRQRHGRLATPRVEASGIALSCDRSIEPVLACLID